MLTKYLKNIKNNEIYCSTSTSIDGGIGGSISDVR